MIRNIIFDCGGVFTEMGLRERALVLSKSERLTDEFMSICWAENGPWQRYDQGEISSEDIAFEIKNALPDEHHFYVDDYVDGWTAALPPKEGMEEVVDALHEKGISCYLLSNFPDCFERMHEQIPALDKLDGEVISSRINMLKPSPEIFRYALESFGIRAEETLFVDDLSVNVQGAESVGIKGYVFKTREEFIAYLKENKIL